MSCTTLYLLRTAEDRLQVGSLKWGDVIWDSPDAVRALLQRSGLERAPSAVGRAEPYHCRGLYLDTQRRIFRCMLCYGTYMLAHQAEAIRRALRGPLWRGWDADYASCGREELVALADGFAPECQIRAPDLSRLQEELVQPVLGAEGPDPQSWSIAASEMEQFERAWLEAPAVISLVEEDGRSWDWSLRSASMESLTLAGPALVGALRGCCPVEPTYETFLHQGAIVDIPERALRYWTSEASPIGWAEALAAAWPGWSVAREPELYWGQLARAGRDPTLWCWTAADLGSLLGPRGPVWPRRALQWRYR